jgi:hypothetical protein
MNALPLLLRSAPPRPRARRDRTATSTAWRSLRRTVFSTRPKDAALSAARTEATACGWRSSQAGDGRRDVPHGTVLSRRRSPGSSGVRQLTGSDRAPMHLEREPRSSKPSFPRLAKDHVRTWLPRAHYGAHQAEAPEYHETPSARSGLRGRLPPPGIFSTLATLPARSHPRSSSESRLEGPLLVGAHRRAKRTSGVARLSLAMMQRRSATERARGCARSKAFPEPVPAYGARKRPSPAQGLGRGSKRAFEESSQAPERGTAVAWSPLVFLRLGKPSFRQDHAGAARGSGRRSDSGAPTWVLPVFLGEWPLTAYRTAAGDSGAWSG